MIKSPLRYPGGKSRAVNLISKIIPNFNEYREPFLGGGSIFIRLKQIFPNKSFWVNDLYDELYQFWRHSQKDMNKLTDKIYKWKTRYDDGKELYEFLKRQYDNLTDLEKAAAFFVYNRITFSGTSLSGGYSDAAFRERFTESSILRLRNIEEIIKNTKITKFDYEKLLMKNVRSVFIFLDPPYFSTRKSALYGKNGNLHKNFDHKRFAESMKRCKHKWLVTYDDSDYIRNLFSFASVFPWDMTYGMRNVSGLGNQSGKEIFISNYLTALPEQKYLNFLKNTDCNTINGDICGLWR